MKKEKNPLVELLLCIFLGWLGIHRFYAGKIWTGILYVFTFGLFGIGWAVDAVMLLVKLISTQSTKKPSNPVVSAMPQTPVGKFHGHDVAGTKYYRDAFIALGTINPEFAKATKKRLYDARNFETVYQYTFPPMDAILVPEPDNPHDPNAVKVMVGGQHIGYIKAGSCRQILNLLNVGKIKNVTCKITGGPSKSLLTYESSPSLSDCEYRDEDGNFYANIKIYENP